MLATTAAGLCLGAAACSHSSTASPPPRTTASPPRCTVPHAVRLTYDRYGALYASRSSSSGRVYRACPAGGSPIPLGGSRCEPSKGRPAVSELRLAGPYVAYVTVRCGVDTAQTSVNVLDMRRRRAVLSAPAVGPPGVPEGVQSVLALRLRADGALAWIGTQHSLAGGRSTRELWTADSRHRRQRLDSGAGIDPRSLRLTAHTVSWRNGSSPRSASLR